MSKQEQKAIPQHIVLFPDGNRRWAKARGLAPMKGHAKGKEKFVDFLTWCKNKGVKIVTVFGFSTENWNRPKAEVNYLMDMFEQWLSEKKSVDYFMKEGVQVRVIGQKERLRASLQKVVQVIEAATAKNTKFILNLGVSYGGRWDITNAVKKIIAKGLSAKDITEETIEKYLSTADQLAPDLVIRAGGERRFSNFLLWQSAYAELYFSPKYWPDFSEKDLEDALSEFALRHRRFGH